MSGLILGPVVFREFELPARMPFGGRQRLAIHRLPGGARVIDTLGYDDGEICWEGVFAGDDATTRARELDLMRVAGLTWPLAWDAFCYTAIVAQFVASYERANWIPYRIACTVVVDEASALETALLSLADEVLSDLGNAAGLGFPSLSGAVSAVAAPGALIAGTGAFGTAAESLGAAGASLDSDLSNAGSKIESPATFDEASSAAEVSARAAAARGFVQRAKSNLVRIGG